MNFNNGVVRVKLSRLWKLKAAIEGVMRRKFITSRHIEILVGHCTWAGLIRRDSLSFFDATYEFVKRCCITPTRIPDRVLGEFWRFRSILPLLSADLHIGWNSLTICSDASPYGIGVRQRHLHKRDVAASGRIREVHRYYTEEATQPRQTALQPSGAKQPTGLHSHQELQSILSTEPAHFTE
eukprot:5718871-Amphidinium_carterae.2